MKIHIKDSTRFAAALAVCKEFHEFVSFNIVDGCLRASVLDSTHVSVTVISISVDIDDYTPGTISVRTDDIVKTIQLGHGGCVTMEPAEDVVYVSLDDSSISAKIRLFDTDIEDMSLDGYEPECTYTLPSHEFFGRIKDISVFGDTVTIEDNNPTGLSVSTSGDVGDIRISIEATREGTSGIKASFACRYINSLAKASKLSDTTTVSLGEDIPARISIVSDDISFQFYLAPKLNDDDT